MIIRTYTDEGKLINEHKISDKDNLEDFYNILSENILKKFNNHYVIQLCIDLLRIIYVEKSIIKAEYGIPIKKIINDLYDLWIDETGNKNDKTRV